jgi:hypothetical protein
MADEAAPLICTKCPRKELCRRHSILVQMPDRTSRRASAMTRVIEYEGGDATIVQIFLHSDPIRDGLVAAMEKQYSRSWRGAAPFGPHHKAVKFSVAAYNRNSIEF